MDISNSIVPFGGLFVENSVSSSLVDSVLSFNKSGNFLRSKGEFLSISLLIKRGEEVFKESNKFLVKNGEKKSVKKMRGRGAINTTKHLWAGAVAAMISSYDTEGRGAINTTKHLWAGAVAAMILCYSESRYTITEKSYALYFLFTLKFSMAYAFGCIRTFVAPLERLKLEYMVRGEQRKLFDLIHSISVTQGLKGFWKGNFVNILRTAPFKAINFYAYDTYRKQLLKFSGNEETTNVERFVAGAAAGITASVLCLPLDTIRTKLVAPGGEALGGMIGAFHYVIQTEGILALYKGLLPSVLSMAPSGAVFYGVYDILKSAYLRSPEGLKRIEKMKRQGQDLNALDQLELGPVRTLLHGAISGVCAEAATYPFEVVRRQLQLQGRASKLSALGTCVNIVEKGGVTALYAGLIPSLLQVLPSAAISYFVYECMKIVLKVE